MPYTPAVKDTILIPTGGGGGNHLFIVATPVCRYGYHLLVNVTTIKPKKAVDQACIIPCRRTQVHHGR
jgi:hypothetical protein